MTTPTNATKTRLRICALLPSRTEKHTCACNYTRTRTLGLNHYSNEQTVQLHCLKTKGEANVGKATATETTLGLVGRYPQRPLPRDDQGLPPPRKRLMKPLGDSLQAKPVVLRRSNHPQGTTITRDYHTVYRPSWTGMLYIHVIFSIWLACPLTLY